MFLRFVFLPFWLKYVYAGLGTVVCSFRIQTFMNGLIFRIQVDEIGCAEKVKSPVFQKP